MAFLRRAAGGLVVDGTAAAFVLLGRGWLASRPWGLWAVSEGMAMHEVVWARRTERGEGLWPGLLTGVSVSR